MENLIKFLEDKITDKMSVEEIVDVFEQMCSTPLEEDMVLFETGTFTAFSKEPFFQISLVRQFSNDDEEFYQIHVVILYKPTAENKIFSETTWDEDLDENIFDYVWHTSILSGSRRAAITAQSLSERFSQKVGLTARNSYVPPSYSRCSSLECRTHCSTAENYANM